MAQMASGLSVLHGEFTPSEDVQTYTIDPGRNVTCFIVQVKSTELISGVRNFQNLVYFDYEGTPIYYATASNSAGSTWGSTNLWYLSNTGVTPISKSGTTFVIDATKVANGAKFYSSRTYEWFAY